MATTINTRRQNSVHVAGKIMTLQEAWKEYLKSREAIIRLGEQALRLKDESGFLSQYEEEEIGMLLDNLCTIVVRDHEVIRFLFEDLLKREGYHEVKKHY